MILNSHYPEMLAMVLLTAPGFFTSGELHEARHGPLLGVAHPPSILQHGVAPGCARTHVVGSGYQLLCFTITNYYYSVLNQFMPCLRTMDHYYSLLAINY